MTTPSPKIVAEAHVRGKTAGEVRFVKDRGGDKTEWAWNTPGPTERDITRDFVFQAKYLKPLAEVLRSSLMALGHATSAHSKLVKVKSRNVSPDGNIGGKGYIQKISDMRRQLMNCIEVLSANSDSLYDELNAPHWDPAEDTLDPRDRDEVREIVEDAEEIKQDPEGWAEEQEDELEDEAVQSLKSASISRVALRFEAPSALQRVSSLMSDIEVPILSKEARADLGKFHSDVKDVTATMKKVNRSLALLGKTNV